MPELEQTAAALDAAAALLLREPDTRLRDLVAQWAGQAPPALVRMRQDFYDVMCVPQSGRFVPAYEHVLRRAEHSGRMWFFPPARHDGGREVEADYARLGFDRRVLDVAPFFRAPHLPGDHLGFMMAFVAYGCRLHAGAPGEARNWIGRALSAFVRHHLGPWVETYAALLEDRGGAYLETIALSVREAAPMARELAAARRRGAGSRPLPLGSSLVGT